MAGIYIHIPFCKKKCHYCDFYSTTGSELIQDLINSENQEISFRKDYLKGESVSSVYFGGGSPSMLSIGQVESLIKNIYDHFNISSEAEITFECNPDDVDLNYLKNLRELGINRLSIGIQSFDDRVLDFLNRRHNSRQAEEAVHWARKAGFTNVSIDLMYAIPGMDNEIYRNSLLKAVNLKTEHISAYNLSIEPNTVLYWKQEKGLLNAIDEETSLYQFEMTMESLKERGFKHYEISNYALLGYESKHNWLYWSNGKYLGIGPSAHSYDGESRQWNVSNTKEFVESDRMDSRISNREFLTEVDFFNEYILTSLRTCEGIVVSYVKNKFNIKIYNHFLSILYKFVNEGYMKKLDRGRWALEKKGIFVLDFVIREFYYI